MIGNITILSIMVYLLTAFISTSAWAGDHTGEPIPFMDFKVTIEGTGVSPEEVINSLTDTNGILRSMTFTDGKTNTMVKHDVVFDQSKIEVKGNHISVPFIFKEMGDRASDGSGTLSVKDTTCTGDGERGKELDLKSDEPKNSNDPIRITHSVFQVCAKAGPGGKVLVHVSSHLIAGPQYDHRAVDAAYVVYAHIGESFQKHALTYAAASTPSGAVAQARSSATSADGQQAPGVALLAISNPAVPQTLTEPPK